MALGGVEGRDEAVGRVGEPVHQGGYEPFLRVHRHLGNWWEDVVLGSALVARKKTKGYRPPHFRSLQAQKLIREGGLPGQCLGTQDQPFHQPFSKPHC